MKKANRVSLAVVLVLFVGTIPLGRAQGMGGMDMKDMNMSKCKEMTQGMDMSKCKDMMGKDKKGMEMKGMGADKKSEVHKGVGTVKKVDPAGGKVTIAHGPIPTMKWPAMSMTFTVKDKALLGKFSQDKKVEFEFVEQGSNYVITSVK
ncbi:MAG: copper-binding protein [Betaproteobacteria bacterium]|nr:MAG: copper-binding protein [Betaproteobacteria bacterium]